MFNPAIANVQDNGAQIIDRRRIKDTWVWLCQQPGQVQPYITWVSSHHKPDETVWGHYFDKFDSAYEDFCERVKQCYITK